MAKRGDAETLVHDVYQQMRVEILSGVLAPEERLKPAELCLRFGVSTGVIREALTMLAEQHLVRGERNKGFQVVSLSMVELRQLTVARTINECGALAQSIKLGDVEWESEVMAAHHLLLKTPVYPFDDPEHTNEGFAEAHERFHFALIQACDNPYLMDICHRLFDASEMYRRWSAGGSKRRNVRAEHHGIMEAALARDVDEAVRRHRDHIERTASDLERRLSEAL